MRTGVLACQLPTARSSGQPVGIEDGGPLERSADRAIDRLPVDRLGIGERRLAEFALEHIAQSPVLADDLRARADQPVDTDKHGMRLLAERVALEQVVSSRPSSRGVTGGKSPFGDDRQRVLESVGQSFALGGEAIVTESFEQVSVIELDGPLRLARRLEQAALEGRHVELDPRLHPDADRVRLDVEHAVGREAGLGESLADEPEGLTQRACRRAVGVGPQVGGDRLAGARPACQHEQGEEGLRVSAGQANGPPRRGTDIEASKEIHLEADSRAGSDLGHRSTPLNQVATSGPSMKGPDARVVANRSPQARLARTALGRLGRPPAPIRVGRDDVGHVLIGPTAGRHDGCRQADTDPRDQGHGACFDTLTPPCRSPS